MTFNYVALIHKRVPPLSQCRVEKSVLTRSWYYRLLFPHRPVKPSIYTKHRFTYTSFPLLTYDFKFQIVVVFFYVIYFKVYGVIYFCFFLSMFAVTHEEHSETFCGWKNIENRLRIQISEFKRNPLILLTKQSMASTRTHPLSMTADTQPTSVHTNYKWQISCHWIIITVDQKHRQKSEVKLRVQFIIYKLQF